VIIFVYVRVGIDASSYASMRNAVDEYKRAVVVYGLMCILLLLR